MGGNVEIDSDVDCDKMVKRSPAHTKATIGAIDYLTPNAKVSFTQLKKTFLEILIFCHFDPKCHIWIKINMSDYVIGGVLSQLTLDNLG